MAKIGAEAQPKGSCSTHLNEPGWKCLPRKKCSWSPDWKKLEEYRQQHAITIQKKLGIHNFNNISAEKTTHSKKRRKQKIPPSISNNGKNKPTDKQLLLMAKQQFSGPPTSTDHPIAALSAPAAKSFIKFKKGETINLGETTRTQNYEPIANTQRNQQQQQQEQPPTPDGQFELDPMRPPIVRLTQQSTEGDGRFLKARLRDPAIMRVVRLFLAYMKDQPPNVCIDGLTPTNIRMLLASEGLPSAPEHLHRIFIEVHQEYGIGPAEATADLQSYRQYLVSERTHRLQQLRETTNRFCSPSTSQNFRK